jgi:hypothetical protein
MSVKFSAVTKNEFEGVRPIFCRRFSKLLTYRLQKHLLLHTRMIKNVDRCSSRLPISSYVVEFRFVWNQIAVIFVLLILN